MRSGQGDKGQAEKMSSPLLPVLPFSPSPGFPISPRLFFPVASLCRYTGDALTVLE